MRTIFIQLITGYQRFLSPVLGQHCRFYPSCSEYMKQSLIKHGLLKGIFFGSIRLLKCQPLIEGGFDPVPKPLEDAEDLT